MRPKGLVTVRGFVDASGKNIPLADALRYGWVKSTGKQPAGWGLAKDEISLGSNLFLDNGREMAANCFGGVYTLADYVCSSFGVGTGQTPPSTTDTQLGSPIALAINGLTTAPLDGVYRPSPFVVQFNYSVGAYATGVSDLTTTIYERGLFSGNGTLVARHVSAIPIIKPNSVTVQLSWRIRF